MTIKIEFKLRYEVFMPAMGETIRICFLSNNQRKEKTFDQPLESHTKLIQKSIQFHFSILPKNEPNAICFRYRAPDVNFTGRSKELTSLECLIDNKRHIVVVSGLGGIGKTQLVRKFIERKRQLYFNVVWIVANDRGVMQEQFKILARSLGVVNVTGVEKDFCSLIEEVFNKLSASLTLVVLDNVDKIENTEFVLKIGTIRVAPHIIITSRIQEWSDSIDLIKLCAFSSEDALEYVSQQLNSSDTVEDKDLLLQTLQNFPIALRQATAHINFHRKQEQFTISDFLMAFDSSREEILNSDLFQRDILNEYEQTTLTTWKITIDAIKECRPDGDLALRILNIISYFDPDHIRRDIFFNLKSNNVNNEQKLDKSEVKRAVRLLINYSMVDSYEQQSVLSIHRLVQNVIKINLEKVSSSESQTLRDGLQALAEFICHENFEQCYEHGISVSLTAFKFNELARDFNEFAVDFLQSLYKFRKYIRSASYGAEILQPLTTILGENHPNTLITKKLITNSFYQLGKYSEALQMHQEAFEKQKIILGENHPDTVISRSNMACSYSKLGKHSEALRIYQELFHIQKTISGEDDPGTLMSKANIATTYDFLGKYFDALQMHQEVLEKRKQILGEDNPSTFITKSNISYLYDKLGKYPEALQMHQEVFEKRLYILGENHPDTLLSEFNIAYSYSKLGKFSDALEMHEMVFEKRKKYLGDNHPDTMASKHNIAQSYDKLGKYAEALKMHQEVFMKLKQIIGEDHPDTQLSKHNIACVYSKLGKYSEALEMHQEVFVKLKNVFGEDHPDTLLIKFNIAQSYDKLGKFSDALRMHQEVLEKRKIFLGEDHPDALLSKSNIASLCYKLEKNCDALQTHREISEKQNQILGENHPDTIQSNFIIANSYNNLGKHSEALKLLQEVIRKQKLILGDDHPDRLLSMSYCACLYYKLGKYLEALKLHQEVYEKQKATLGEDHPQTLLSKSNIANCKCSNNCNIS